MNIDLMHYVGQARKSGMTDEEIKQGIMQAGWPETEITEAIAKASPVMPEPPSSTPRLTPNLPPRPSVPPYRSPSHWIAVILAILAVIGFFMFSYYYALWPFGALLKPLPAISPTPTPSVIEAKVIYRNEVNGFSIPLSDSWKEYSVINSQWEGRDIDSGNVIERGPLITLRHPKWTEENPREDMPVMIFTPEQWRLVEQEQMAVGAAPIPPSILGQNSKYVIALPARYNYDYKPGWEEVDKLVRTLKTSEPSPSANIDTSTWKTYRNDEYGFEFKYPEGFELAVFRDKFLVNNNDRDRTSFGVYLEQNILGANGIKPFQLAEARKYSIDGKETIAYVQEDNSSGLAHPRRYILLNVNKYNKPLWIIGTFPIDKPESEELIGKFISTVKFINPDPVATWKTFIDGKNRFEIKYPEDFHVDYSKEYPSGDYRVFGVNDVGGTEPYLYFSVYAKPERTIDEVAACREAGGGYISKYYMDEKIDIGGQFYIKCYYDRELQKDQALFISFNKNGYRWEFLAIHYDKYKTIIEQILLTFKFTK